MSRDDKGRTGSDLPAEAAQHLDTLRSTVLGALGTNLLLRLLRLATPQVHEAGAVLCRAGDDVPGFWLMLDGIVNVIMSGPDGEEVFAEQRAGDVFGSRSLVTNRPCPVTLRVDEEGPAKVLFFRRADFEALLQSSGAAREALWPLLPPPVRDALAKPEVLQLVSTLPGLPLSALTVALAQTITKDFPNDRVLVVTTTGATATPSVPQRHEDNVWYATAQDPGQYKDFDYIFVIGALPPGMKLDTAVQITDGVPALPPGVSANATLVTVLVTPNMPVRRHGLTTASDGVSPHLPTFEGVWIELDLAALQARVSASPATPLSSSPDSSLSRWARAVTHRRVGIALSGGGAWGFYHSVILRKLAERDVPIDIITSASMGSIIGAYYSALGLEGLDLVYERTQSWTMTLYALAAVFSTASIQLLVQEDLGKRYLEQLLTRFHPVTTDLTTSDSVVALEGSLSLAVRASASAPGVWAPTLVQPKHWYVDGCVANDLPVSWLAYLGADLTFASNCYPAGLREYRQLLPGRLGKLLSTNNPLNRLVDLSTSGSVLLNRSGFAGGELADTFFNVNSTRGALIDAMSFSAVDKIIEQAETDPNLQQAIDDFTAQWEALKLRGRVLPTPLSNVVPLAQTGS